MRVLISLSHYHPHISGLSDYAKNLSEFMSRSGYEVEVVCCKNTPDLVDEEVISGVTVRRFEPTIKVGRGMFSLGLISWVVTNLHRFDLLIVNLPFPEAAVLTLATTATGTKVISVFHCDLKLGKNLFDRLITVINTATNFIALQRSKFVVVNSVDYSDSITLLSRFKPKIREINPLINLPNSKDTNKSKLSNVYKVGFLGRISKEKNLETLIEAIEMINNIPVKLIIAGPMNTAGENEYTRAIMAKLKNLGSRVELWGEVSEYQKKKFFQYIDVLVLPSDNSTESFGIVQVEALAYGVPVLATNLPGVRDIAMKTGAGLLVNEARNIKQWIKAINLSREKYNELKNNTTKLYLAYDTNVIAKKWKELLNF